MALRDKLSSMLPNPVDMVSHHGARMEEGSNLYLYATSINIKTMHRLCISKSANSAKVCKR